MLLVVLGLWYLKRLKFYQNNPFWWLSPYFLLRKILPYVFIPGWFLTKNFLMEIFPNWNLSSQTFPSRHTILPVHHPPSPPSSRKFLLPRTILPAHHPPGTLSSRHIKTKKIQFSFFERESPLSYDEKRPILKECCDQCQPQARGPLRSITNGYCCML